VTFRIGIDRLLRAFRFMVLFELPFFNYIRVKHRNLLKNDAYFLLYPSKSELKRPFLLALAKAEYKYESKLKH
jgi:hypothetical protein